MPPKRRGRPRKRQYTPEEERLSDLKKVQYQADKAERTRVAEEDKKKRKAEKDLLRQQQLADQQEQDQQSGHDQRQRTRSGRLVRRVAQPHCDVTPAHQSSSQDHSEGNGSVEPSSQASPPDEVEQRPRQQTNSQSKSSRKKCMEVEDVGGGIDEDVTAATSSFPFPPEMSFPKPQTDPQLLNFRKDEVLKEEFTAHFIDGADSSPPPVTVYTRAAGDWTNSDTDSTTAEDQLCSTASIGSTRLAFVGGLVLTAEPHDTWPVLALSAQSTTESHHPIGKTCVGETWVQFWIAAGREVSFSHASRLHIGFVRQLAWVESQLAVVGGHGHLSLMCIDSLEHLQQKLSDYPTRLLQVDGLFQTSVAYSPKRKQIVSGTYQGSIIVWDAKPTGKSIDYYSFRAHRSNIRCVAVNDRLNCFASGGDDGYVCVWKIGVVRLPLRKIQLGVSFVTTLRWKGALLFAGTSVGFLFQFPIHKGCVTDELGMSEDALVLRSQLGFRKCMVWDLAVRNGDEYRHLVYCCSSDGLVVEQSIRPLRLKSKRRVVSEIVEISATASTPEETPVTHIKILGGVRGASHVKDRIIGGWSIYPTKLVWWEPHEADVAWFVVLSSAGYATFLPVAK